MGSVLVPSAGHVVGWLVVAGSSAAVVIWRLAPASWRPNGGVRSVVTATVTTLGAYLAVSVGHDLGFNGWLDYDVIEVPLRAEVDDFDTWLVAVAAPLALLGVVRLSRALVAARRTPSRSRSRS